jgi:hypothetical protein
LQSDADRFTVHKHRIGAPRRFWRFVIAMISRKTRRREERRKVIRYRLSVPVVFSWASARRDRFRGEGSTRDISSIGAYILTPTSPPVDAEVNVEIMLSAPLGTNKAWITGKVRVRRVTHENTKHGQSGFSVVGQGFELRAKSENESESDIP